MKDKIKVVYNDSYVILSGPTAFEVMFMLRQELDSKGIKYTIYTKDYIFWKRMYTINDLKGE